jgi:hypothetical protein
MNSSSVVGRTSSLSQEASSSAGTRRIHTATDALPRWVGGDWIWRAAVEVCVRFGFSRFQRTHESTVFGQGPERDCPRLRRRLLVRELDLGRVRCEAQRACLAARLTLLNLVDLTSADGIGCRLEPGHAAGLLLMVVVGDEQNAARSSLRVVGPATEKGGLDDDASEGGLSCPGLSHNDHHHPRRRGLGSSSFSLSHHLIGTMGPIFPTSSCTATAADDPGAVVLLTPPPTRSPVRLGCRTISPEVCADALMSQL